MENLGTWVLLLVGLRNLTRTWKLAFCLEFQYPGLETFKFISNIIETLKVPGREKDFCDGLKQAIDYAVAVNCKAIHIMVGNFADSEENWSTPTNHRATLIKNLNWAAPLLAAKGIIG